MNRIEIVGNLVGNPELTYTNSGKAVATATVASDRGRSRDAGTDFLRLQAWEERAELLTSYSKGAFIRVIGSVRTDRSERAGQMQYYFTVNVHEIEHGAKARQDIA